jgi:hypothetical protein
VRLRVAVTATEAARICEAADAAGLSLADWFRTAALRGRPPRPAPHLALRELWAESAPAFANLNQIAAHFNLLHAAGELSPSAALEQLSPLRAAVAEAVAAVQALRLELAGGGDSQ